MEENLPQFLAAWIGHSTTIKEWIKEKYMSHDVVNELIRLMGHKVLRLFLSNIKRCKPSWYSIIAVEATDIIYNEQFNVSIQYVDDDYVVCEDSIGLVPLPNITASTLAALLRDMLTCCALPLSLCI